MPAYIGPGHCFLDNSASRLDAQRAIMAELMSAAGVRYVRVEPRGRSRHAMILNCTSLDMSTDVSRSVSKVGSSLSCNYPQSAVSLFQIG